MGGRGRVVVGLKSINPENRWLLVLCWPLCESWCKHCVSCPCSMLGLRITHDNAPHKYTRSQQDPLSVSVSLMTTRCTFLSFLRIWLRAEYVTTWPKHRPLYDSMVTHSEFVHLSRPSLIRRCHHHPQSPVASLSSSPSPHRSIRGLRGAATRHSLRISFMC